MNGRRKYNHLSATRVGRMQIVCASCHKDLGSKFCKPEFSGTTTHGTCLDCDARIRKELGLEPERKVCPTCFSPSHAECRGAVS